MNWIIVYSVVLVLLIIGLLWLWNHNRKLMQALQDFQKQNAEVYEKAKFLELENISSKLNPHLFKNILNSIQSHAYQTYYAIDKMSGVLDYILYESQKNRVTPKDELYFTQQLIEVNKIKLSPLFELSVKTKIDTEDSFYNMPVIPPLITVDLIENAFKHADIQSPDSFINIVLECRNAYFKITVSNKISSQPKLLKEKSGIGLQNLEKRLNLIYGNNYKLNIGIDGDSYVAQLKIDFKDATA